jgi:hypothetical protein
MRKVALLPILLLITFSSSPLSALTLGQMLGTANVEGNLNASTCFAACTENDASGPTAGNVSIVTPDSAAQTTAVLSTNPSISARSEADVVSEGGVGSNSFSANASAENTLHYYFEIVGPQNITLPVLVQANGTFSITGNFASTGYSYVGETSLAIDGGSQFIVNVDPFIETGAPGGQSVITTMSSGFSVDRTANFLTNTPYEVLMKVNTGASVEEYTAFGNTVTSLSDLVSTASIDPSFQIGPGFSDYSIFFSAGIGDTAAATPLPATLPLFAGGLGFVGYLAKRRKKNAALAAA